MSEQFNIGAAYDNYTNFEKSAEETTVIIAAKEAKMRAEQVTLYSPEVLLSMDTVDDNTRELDEIIKYVLNTRLILTGIVQFTSKGDESERIFIEDIDAEFLGFFISRRDEKVYYDYLYKAATDNNGHLLTRDQLYTVSATQTKGEHGMVYIQAQVDEVFMKFDEMHPVRALAYLQEHYPDVLRQLDEILIGRNGKSDEESIASLSHFALQLPLTISDEERQTLLQSIKEYIKAMVILDDQPYRIHVKGSYADFTKNLDEATIEKMDGEALFTLSRIEVYDVTDFSQMDDDSDPVVKTQAYVGLYGRLHSSDPINSSKYVMLPAESISSVDSLRVKKLEIESDPKHETEEAS